MLAIVCEKFGSFESLTLKEVPLPKPGRSDVRIKIHTTGFNPVDFKIRKGEFGAEVPIVLGAECSGVIDQVGDRVHDFSVGDEVYTFAMGPISNGTYAQYICLPMQFVAKKPKNLSFEKAAGIPLTYLTAFQSLIRTGALEKERPFFLAGGSGGVGTAAIQLAKCYGAGPVFTMAGSEESREYLEKELQVKKEHILTYCGLNLSQMAQKLVEMNQNERFYLAFDCVGGLLKQLCFEVLAISGHLVSILPEEEPISIFDRKKALAFAKSLSIHVKFLGAAALKGGPKDWMAYHAQLTHLTEQFEAGKLAPPKVENVGSFSAETVQEAHKRLEEGHTKGKLVMSI